MEPVISELLKTSSEITEINYLNMNELKILLELEKVLLPFKILSEELCTDKFPSLAKEVSLWLTTRDAISGQQMELTEPAVKVFRTLLHNTMEISIPSAQVLTELERRKRDKQLTPLIATLLHPGNKYGCCRYSNTSSLSR